MAHIYINSGRTTGNANPQTFSYDCGTDATLLVVGVVTAGGTIRAGGTITYNGRNMTQVGVSRSATETCCEMWYLDWPDTGAAYNISIPNTGTARTVFVQASSWQAQNGYRSTLDVWTGMTATSAGSSLPITGTTDGNLYIDVLGCGDNAPPTANNQVKLFSVDDGNYSDNSQYALQTTAGSIRFTWTFTSDDWCSVLAGFKEYPKRRIYHQDGR